MRHPKRIIRRLRKERGQLEQEIKQHETLLSNIQRHIGEPSPSSALTYVRYIEECNRNQEQTINDLNEKTDELRMQLIRKDQDFIIDVVIVVSLLALFGFVIYFSFFS